MTRPNIFHVFTCFIAINIGYELNIYCIATHCDKFLYDICATAINFYRSVTKDIIPRKKRS